MTEYDDSGHRKEDRISSEKKKDPFIQDESEIIELSDIAIGTTPEDEMIVELTEEVIDEAMNGISGATGETLKEGEKILDLSNGSSDTEVRFEDLEQGDNIKMESMQPGDLTGHLAMEPEDVEDHISKELDEFFGTDEVSVKEQLPVSDLEPKIQTEKLSIPESELIEAVEIVIKKLYGDTIDKLIADGIEKAVASEINRIKEFLTSRTKE
jgi:hypothetical protein